MKNMSIKKIVLCSLGLLSAILLLIGLAFNVVSYDLTTGSGYDSVINNTLDLADNGFDMLSFKFNSILLQSFDALYINDEFVEIFAGLFGACSLVILLLSIAAIIVIILSMIKSDINKCKRVIVSFVIPGLIFALAYTVIAIFYTENLNSIIAKPDQGVAVYKYTTQMYGSMIMQVLLLIALIVCDKLIKDKDLKTNANNVTVTMTSDKSSEKSSKIDALPIVEVILNEELSLIKVIREYKLLCDQSIISTADFVSKKAAFLKYSSKNISKLLVVKEKAPIGLVKEELIVLGILKEYKNLVDEDIISSADYMEVKTRLLTCIIG